MKLLASFFLALVPCFANGAEKPNIVFILSDDVGTGDIKCYYPSSKVMTPHIDQLASQGMKFTQAYANGAVCSPSRYALLTGAYPCRGPLRSEPARYTTPLTINPNALSLPRFMKQQGYRTAHIGKWHLGYGESGIKNWAGLIKPGPLEIGFDYTLGLPTNHSDGFKTYVENHRLKWLKDSVLHLDGKPDTSQLTEIRYDDEVDSTLTAKAIEFIKEDSTKPFFVYLALVATHTHITPRADFRGTSQIGQLGDYIHELDYHVGEIMATLDELGIADKTVLIFTSDNGGMKSDVGGAGKNLNLRSEANDVALKSKTAKTDAREKFGHKTNGDLQGYKGSNFEGGFRVPFIVRWPGKVAAGTESNQTITLADTLATTAGILNQQLPKTAGVDSFDFSPVLLGKRVGEPIRTTTILQTGHGLLAFRHGDWKLRCTRAPDWTGEKVTLPKDSPELYNLATDPTESTDLAESEPERVQQMQMLLLKLLRKGRS
ncbi:sulfatase family protein [Novipirellula artificiosorum]|uniref:Arylsulfatase n=1 Tax=Novipirellula artificiosorum TaxID=2528016 RepID=A0A5C6DAK5_9BACT|nr:arylsulfatase [Novipirellula artificiosorum]TWU33922.1 Arylsulfatase [Novipirellula artificiosorum]